LIPQHILLTQNSLDSLSTGKKNLGVADASIFISPMHRNGVSHHFVIALERHIQSGNGIAK
jgi:hypothetical protein